MPKIKRFTDQEVRDGAILYAKGASKNTIAKKYGTTEATVSRWQGREIWHQTLKDYAHGKIDPDEITAVQALLAPQGEDYADVPLKKMFSDNTSKLLAAQRCVLDKFLIALEGCTIEIPPVMSLTEAERVTRALMNLAQIGVDVANSSRTLELVGTDESRNITIRVLDVEPESYE